MKLPLNGLKLRYNYTMSISMQAQDNDPLWDEGISSYLVGEYEKQKKPLTSADLQNIANEWAVRVGDLLETLFLMSISGVWQYYDAEDGSSIELDEVALDELYAKGRVSADDMKEFSGVWSPVS